MISIFAICMLSSYIFYEIPNHVITYSFDQYFKLLITLSQCFTLLYKYLQKSGK